MSKRQLFNTSTQQIEEAELTVDPWNCIIATFANGTFAKFPAGLTADEFENLIVQHELSNRGQVIITPEMQAAEDAAHNNSLALIGEAGDTTPEGQQSNATEPTTETATAA